MKEKKRKISDRNLKILADLSRGYTDAEIAEKFGISKNRVRQIIDSFLYATGTVNRAHLVYEAVKTGLIV